MAPALPWRSRLALTASVLALIGALAGCGRAAPTYTTSPNAGRDIPAPARAGSTGPARLLDWPEFGLTPARANTSDRATGISPTNVGHLHRLQVQLPGTVDSSPVYLHRATVNGAVHDVAIVTTSYGRTVAVDATNGQMLWVFTPPGYSGWAGSDRITTTSPLIDPDRRSVYAAAPDGRIYRLTIAGGRSSGGAWPVSVTRDARHEKLAAAINLDGPYLVVATGGYLGDPPPYQGHIALIERASGRLVSVWNSLCAQRRALIATSSCSGSDSAIWARGGAVVAPDGGLLVATGNGPYDGRSNFGDSVVALAVPGLGIRQTYTPVDQHQLAVSDSDLGSSAPALLGSDLAAQGGKDGVLRLLNLRALDGRPPGSAPRLGGERQRLPTPGGAPLFSAPAVWGHGGSSTLFVADNAATGAYVLSNGRLRLEWSNTLPGTSPVLAGGLLYVYDPNDGGVNVYAPGSARPVTKLACPGGHWNSPIVVDGHVIVPVGNANDHSQRGSLVIFSA